MVQDAPIPNWAKDRRTFMRMNVAIAVAVTVLLVGAAFIAPMAIGSIVDALFSPLLLIALATTLLVVSGVRRIVLGPARKEDVRPGPLLVTYVLSALPVAVAALSVGALVTLAFVFQWQPRFAFVQSLLLLLVGFVLFSVTVKIVLNTQMLVRHWQRR